MGLEEQVEHSQNIGYGIHGTNDPSSIGTSASNGCIRMNNRDVEELYDILPYGVDVEIVE
jgi:lipoprotein-anchoring transpeptidase ErfK/SrfK